ncbi:hypothetical protein MLD38_000318 [Melastoma candidum]|uniref:Uncharacterized protein n=1 Tax=Melastoma candidum TaxID=119954 RepID=A0ACB9SAM4_9MYRT|nr:hypothetical protein MLD38_000318 [Melastoma candidum]
MFDEMSERTVVSWTAMISGYARIGQIDEAMRLFEVMPERDVPSWNALIAGCTQNGLFPEAMDLFRRMGLQGWNSMINCFALRGQTKSAIGMFEEMLLTAGDIVTPDRVTFIGLLNACIHGGLVDIGRQYFEMMSGAYGIEPRIEHYGFIIDLLGRAGRFDEALAVIGVIKIPPDEVVWGSLVNGCKIHGHLDLAEFALEKLLELDPNNGGYGAMLANAYGELGKWDDVRRVTKTLKEQDAHKTPGCSWVEVNNRLHQFYSLDLSHCRSVEIYAMLDSLAAVA